MVFSGNSFAGFEDVCLNNGAVLTNVYVIKNRSAKENVISVFKSVGCDLELMSSLQNEDARFKIPQKDEKIIKKEYNNRKMRVVLKDIFLYGGGVLGIWMLSFVVGWIVRGFAGIQMRKDF